MRRFVLLLVFVVHVSQTRAAQTEIPGGVDIDIYGSETELSVFNTRTLNAHSGAEIGRILARNESTINVYAGADIAFIEAHDDSITNTFVGSEISWLTTHDQAIANVNGGDISWLTARDNSVLHVRFAEELSWLRGEANSEVHVYGLEFAHSRGRLSGVWENGQSFEFWAIEGTYGAPGALPSSFHLHIVPEPTPSVAMPFACLALLLAIRRRA